MSNELGFDISKIEQVKNGWNSNSAVARAASVAEFVGNAHVTLPMARQWPPLPNKPIVSDFSQTKLATLVKVLKASLIDSIGARQKSFNYPSVVNHSRSLL